MASWRGVKSLNKSALPGVAITQFVEDIPKGYSPPDFERKPITVTLQEGKNAIFRAVVKGEPKPKVLWKCSNREMDDSQKYQISFNPATNEFIFQINKITSDDADLYRCIAVNEYGEAACTAGLKIIEVDFKKKTLLPVTQQADLKKEIQDFRKTLKKRTPSAVPKKKMDMEQIAQILINAEKKDYEKICLKYGVVDFRGMLRKLQEMKKAREDKQAQYVYSIANLKHLKVNKEQRNATFDLEMELKNPESRICLYKDGQKINFGVNDDNLRHRLQQEGKNYHFMINDLQPDDAGIYQVKVEDVDIFSTELEAESIKNFQSSDKETYTIDTGSCSSSTWLEVKSSKEKRKQSEEDSSDKAGQWSKPLDEEHAKKRHQGERQKDQDLLADFSMGKDAQYGNGHDSNAELYNSLEKDGYLRSDEKIGFDQNAVLGGNIRGIGSLTDKISQYGKNAMLVFNTGPEGTNRWQNSEGQVSTLNGVDPADRFNRGSVLGFQDSILGTAEVNSNQYIVGYNAGSGVGFDITEKVEGLYGKEVTLGDSHQSGVRFDSNGSLCIKDGELSGAGMLYFKDNKLSEIGGRSRLYRDGCLTAEFDVTGGDKGVAGKFYDKDNHLEEVRGLRPQLDGTKNGYGNMVGGLGDGGTMNEIYVNDVVLAESEMVARFPSAGGIVVYCGTKGMPPESGTGRHNDAERLRVLHNKDSMIVDADTCKSGKKDVLKGAVRPDGTVSIDGYYNMDVVLQGMSACNLANNIDGLYNKNDILRGTGAIGQDRATSVSSLYCKHSTLDGAVVGGPYTIRNINEHHGKEVELNGADARGIGRLYDWKLGNYGKLGRTEGTSGHCGKDGMLGETDTNIAGSAGGIDTLYGKGVLLDKIGANEYGNTVNITGLNDKNGIPNKASSCGADSSSGHDMLYGKGFSDAKDTGRIYGKDAMQNEADTSGLPGQSIMPCGFYSDGGGVREIDGLYVKGGILRKVDASRGIFDKNSIIIGTVDDEISNGERLASKTNVIGETARMYDKNGMSDGLVSPGGVSRLYDKDGMLSGTGASGPIGAGSTAVFYSKNSMPNDTSTAGFRMGDTSDGVCAGCKLNGKGDIPGVTGRREIDSKDMDESYDKDGIPNRTCTIGYHGSVVHSLYDKDGIESIPLTAGTNKSGGICNIDGNYGKDKMPNVVDSRLGDVGRGDGQNILCRAGPIGYVIVGRIYDKDSVFNQFGAGNIEGAGESICTAGGKRTGFGERNDISKREILDKLDGASNVSGLYGKNGYLIGNGVAGELDGLYGKNGVPGSRSISGIMGISGQYGKDDALSSTIAGEAGFNNERNFNYHYNEDIVHCGDSIGVRDANRSLHEKKSDILGEEFLGYDQASGLYDAVSHAGDRRKQLSDLEASGSTPADLSRKGRGEKLLEEDLREPLCHLHQGLFDLHAQKGKRTELSCRLNNDQVKGTWFKDGVKVTGLGAFSTEKNGPVHKLIIDKVEDSHAGKYKFEAEGICTEASIFVEDPPNVDSTLLEKLKKEPIMVKAGKNAMVKIPFEGRKPIRVMWLKENQELLDDDRINIDSSENFTRLSIPSTSRKDTGDYKVRLKNECGSFEVPLKLEVIDKPQSPTGPVAVVDSSANGITIQWKPPRDDGGKPIQSYIIERQQVGRKTWVTLGKTSGSSTIFTTNKVEHDTSYYFRVKAVNSLGTSEALESDEVMAAAKASPSPPAPPKVNSANKDAITISWSAPHKIGNSRILGYRVEKRKKGSNFWTSVTDLPITDRKYTVNNLKEGLQYEFRVAAINNSGVGEASAPSEAIYAQDPMKPPGPVKDLKVVNTDYCSFSLSWMKPESAEESFIKGYIVEIRHSDTLKWTRCNTVPIQTTTYTFRGLKAREPYFLRVRAISDGGLGDAVEVDTCVQAVPSSGGQEAGERNDMIQCNEDKDRKVRSYEGPVNPKFLVKDTVESFMNVKAGDAIHVRIPFEASPSSEVIWLKDGLSLPVKATIATKERLSQLIIPEAELSDSGHYAISLQTEHGRKETFSFQVRVQDIPESPGPIQLIEKVPGTVTLIWEPSPTEKRDGNITYMVMRCDSRKGPWQMVADDIYTNKYTVVNFIPGREYFFRVLAKNCVGVSKPSETVNPWTIQKEKDKPEMKLLRYKGINRDQPPRFLVQLKPHVVNLGFNCHMSCAVTGDPAPQVTWYKGNKNLSQDPAFLCKNDFGVCSLVIPGVTSADAGQYKVLAVNELGQAISKAELTVKGGD
ncbi:immunoglobulin-like and fibronectin type III domain-containing protein 1 [Pantherophis guttatus]|uniref:immunoglobulin-like and fibronectin type III domain-containing protein 1 n=1 Tax=Pantherophis guttatus TaxID=94885 RepID=UPI001481D1D7|nr:immunoglobulin-like and fibronectin type III domain-containing protein 1 [Pantherophis guttatus]